MEALQVLIGCYFQCLQLARTLQLQVDDKIREAYFKTRLRIGRVINL
jgi:hypothetical protein